MHSARPYGPAGLLSPWTVRPLDVRNPLGDALSSERSALTRMFFDAGTVHQVDSARWRSSPALTEATELGVVPREVTWRD